MVLFLFAVPAHVDVKKLSLGIDKFAARGHANAKPQTADLRYE